MRVFDEYCNHSKGIAVEEEEVLGHLEDRTLMVEEDMTQEGAMEMIIGEEGTN